MVYREGGQKITRLFAALEEVPDVYREVLLLYLNGDEYRHIADKLEITEEEAIHRKEEACRYLCKHSEDILGILMGVLFRQV